MPRQPPVPPLAPHVQASLARALPTAGQRPASSPPAVLQGFFPAGLAPLHPGPAAATAVQPKSRGPARQVPPTWRLPTTAGERLPPAVQAKMEGIFAADFSNVRIHVGPEAAAIGALAFTLGSHLYFAPGHYNPASPHGQRLLGHELAHVVQQRSGRVPHPFANGVAVVQDPRLEAEAERMAARAALPVTVRRPPAPATRHAGSAIQRAAPAKAAAAARRFPIHGRLRVRGDTVSLETPSGIMKDVPAAVLTAAEATERKLAGEWVDFEMEGPRLVRFVGLHGTALERMAAAVEARPRAVHRHAANVTAAVITHVYQRHTLEGILEQKQILSAYEGDSVAIYEKGLDEVRALAKDIHGGVFTWTIRDGDRKYWTDHGDTRVLGSITGVQVDVETFFPTNYNVPKAQIQKRLAAEATGSTAT